jgi:protein-tyrosine phosphatase
MLNDVLGYDPPADTYAPLLDHNAARIAAVVDAVATAPPGPVLVHCFGGCDRTGVLVALLLSVAGVAPGIIAADFARPPGRDAAAMVTTLRHLTSAYGGAAAYLGRSGVDDATLRTVAARFRDD